MAVATLFDGERPEARTSAKLNGRKSALLSLLSGSGPSESAGNDIPAFEPEPASPAPRRLSLHEYLRGVDMMIRTTERAQINHTLVNVSPAEIQGLVDKTAKAKARYLASVLDAAANEGLPDAASVKAVEAARERHEALDTGLRALLEELRRGNVRVEGVGDESGHAEANGGANGEAPETRE